MPLSLSNTDLDYISMRHKASTWLYCQSCETVGLDIGTCGLLITAIGVTKSNRSIAVHFFKDVEDYLQNRNRLLEMTRRFDKVYAMFEKPRQYEIARKIQDKKWPKTVGCLYPSRTWRECNVRRPCRINNYDTTIPGDWVSVLISKANERSVMNILDDLENFSKKIPDVIREKRKKQILAMRYVTRKAREEKNAMEIRSQGCYEILRRCVGWKIMQGVENLGEVWRFLRSNYSSGEDGYDVNPRRFSNVMKDILIEVGRRNNICNACSKRKKTADSDFDWTTPEKTCLKCGKMPEVRTQTRRVMKSRVYYDESVRDGNVPN